MSWTDRPLSRRTPRLIGLVLFLVALLVRLAPLNRYVTPDEPIWVLRSVHFADAVAARDWAAIPQTGHPGLTTMALGALGIRLTAWLQPAVSAEHLTWLRNVAWLAPENATAFDHLASFLPACRALVMLVTAVGVAFSYTLGRARLGERTARLLALFLALDPFFAGLSGVLHTDALQATLILLATLLVIPKRTSLLSTWGSLTTAALCLALAGMTKTLGLLVAPGLALASLLLSRDSLRQRIARVTYLTLTTTAFYLFLYPPFWLDPRAAFTSLLAATTYHEGIGLRDIFFAGRMTVDPGPLFYPTVLLFRLTPPVLIGLALAAFDAIRRKGARPKILATCWFLAPVLLYLTVLTLATKKFDRYALTAMVLLAGVAAITWTRHFAHWKWVLLIALLLPWALVAPLPLYYANPLAGGPWLAQRIIPLGWGESYGLAAARLSQHLPDASAATVLSADVPDAAPYFPGVTLPYDDALVSCAGAVIADGASMPLGDDVASTMRLAGLPLATIYTHMLDLPDDVPLLLPGALPGAPDDAVAPVADTATLRNWLVQRFPAGETFLWVHAPDCYPVTEAQLVSMLHDEANVTCEPAGETSGLALERCVIRDRLPESVSFAARFAGTLDLIAASWPEAAPSAPDVLSVRLRWRSHAPQNDLTLYLALRGPDGDVVWAEGGNVLVDDRAWRAPVWETGAFIEGTAYIPLPLTLPPGTYTLTLNLSNSAGGWMGLTLPDGTFGGTLLELGAVDIVPPRYVAAEVPGLVPLNADFAGLRLLGVSSLPETLWAGDRMPFRLGWERLSDEAPDTLRWMLACAGDARDTGELPLAAGDPAMWPNGHRYETRYAPRTDPLLPGGECTLSVHVAGAPPVALGTITVKQRARDFAFAQPPSVPLDVVVGDFGRFVGVDMPQGPLTPDATVDVRLYFEAEGAAERDYTVFVHLVDEDGRVWAQSDGWPVRGAAPTSSWVEGQALMDVHTLSLPSDAPQGTYTLFVGLYDAEHGGRVSLYDETGTQFVDDRVPVSVLKIGL